MRFKLITALILALALLSLPAVSMASTPTLPPPPSSLPSITYYYGSTHYSITQTEWNSFFSDVIDNKSLISYNWTNVSTQDLIVFDLSYTGLNPYGLELVVALSQIGFPSVQNMTKAFISIENKPSQISGYTNIQALDAGAYPGFSFSKPVVNHTGEYIGIGVIVVLFASIFVLYYVFNRRK
ncbi:hypothetical membrane protein [Thermoplasma acidophilum]|uniref:Hypothetical membrane protein n=1 Tax=Thermoplasma acidophilum (strain ATCC 25905 / DSM 1728 / JCM 9062 / NBRC 15155 / AMRC-C165) TaxID=273075 RepID=Q9HJ71_THEAC|nr:hypothetical protein [Thermoplasma acidophilum]MCY0851834.1 hypothetical protein [Thermoplasma acidophilum]CAC12228.1 hypothetical membrane protein [Thermoplasma acidophilum]